MRTRCAWAVVALVACGPLARGETLDEACKRLCKAAAGVRDLYQYMTATEHPAAAQHAMMMTMSSSAELYVLRDGEQRLARCFSETSFGWERPGMNFDGQVPSTTFSSLVVFDGKFLWVEARAPGRRGALSVVKAKLPADKVEALPTPRAARGMERDAAGVLVARTPKEAFGRLEVAWTLKLKGRGAYKGRRTTIVEAVAKPGKQPRVRFAGWQKPIARRVLHFDDATGSLLAIKGYDKGGTEIRSTDTTNLKVNAGDIEKGLFTYTPPKEANVEDRTKAVK